MGGRKHETGPIQNFYVWISGKMNYIIKLTTFDGGVKAWPDYKIIGIILTLAGHLLVNI